MTTEQKIAYLLDNGYVQGEHKDLGKIFTSYNGYIRFTIGDITHRWNSLMF
jgi:hypothetical protein